MKNSITPFITVVMPVRNEARFIRETLMRLLGQDYPSNRFEIIVADGMSGDGTRSIILDMAKTYPQIRFLENPERLSSAGRNIGFRCGRGDYFLVVDGHCHLPDNMLLRNVVDCFEISGADCLGRPQPLDPPGRTPLQKAISLARASWLGHGRDSLIYGGYEGYASPVSNGAVYRRKVFEIAGYVDEDFDAAEDVEFNYRVEKAGLKCYTSPKLAIRYYPRETLAELFRQMTRYGKGRCRFFEKHPEALTITQLIPACFTGGLGISMILWSLAPFSLLAFWAAAYIGSMYFLYILLVCLVSMRIAQREGEKCLLLLLLKVFFVIHAGLGWGFCKRLAGILLTWPVYTGKDAESYHPETTG